MSKQKIRSTDGQYLKKMGAKIRAARKAKGLYMHQLATLCKLGTGAICDIEIGKSNVHILSLKVIADILQIDVKDFL